MSQEFFDSLAEFNAEYTPEKVKEAEATVRSAAKSGSYDFGTVKSLLKAYNTISGNGVEVKADMVALMLAMALTSLPKKDFLQLSYLIPGRLNSDPQVAAMLKLADMLERAQFPSFWKELEAPEARAVTGGVGKFEDSMRGFMLEVIAMSWKNIDKSQLGAMLGMSNPDEFLKSSDLIVKSSIAGNVVEFVSSSDTSDGVGKKQSDLVAKVADISKLISTK
jgi:hypothetical protein